ncbi:MAG: hypothetical protein M3Y28_08030 [Armatimonadota bacterium]|nr:hypothetical protein [Armatimonadota bacterium]
MKFGLIVVICGFVGMLLGYIVGFTLGSTISYRTMPAGATPGDGLSALLLGFLITGASTLVGLAGGLWLPFVMRRSKR